MTGESSGGSQSASLRTIHYLVLLVLAVILALLSVKRSWSDGDEGRYLILAKAVSQGHGQVSIQLPEPEPEWLTPPGYVWLLGLTDRVTGGSMLAMRLLSVVAYIVGVMMFAAFASRRNNASSLDILLGLCTGLFPVVLLSHAWMLMTETTYIALAAGALWIAFSPRGDVTLGRALATGFLAGSTMLVRPAGMALVMAVVATYVFRRHWRAALTAGVAAASCYIPVIVRSMRLAGVPFPHMTHFSAEAASTAPTSSGATQLVGNIVESFPEYLFTYLPNHLFYSLFDYRCLLCLLHLSWLVTPLSIAIGALVVVGFLRNVRKPGVGEWYFLLSWPFLCAYNQPDYEAAGTFFYQPRYLIPLLPLAGLYLVEGIRAVSNWLSRWDPWPARVATFASVLCAAYVIATAFGAGWVRTRNELAQLGRHDFEPERQLAMTSGVDHAFGRFIEAAQWLVDGTPADAIVVSRKPDHVYLFSGRRGFRYDGADTHTKGTVWEIIEKNAGDGPLYILQDGFPAETGYGHSRVASLDPAIEAHRANLELVYETQAPVTRVWRVIK